MRALPVDCLRSVRGERSEMPALPDAVAARRNHSGNTGRSAASASRAAVRIVVEAGAVELLMGTGNTHVADFPIPLFPRMPPLLGTLARFGTVKASQVRSAAGGGYALVGQDHRHLYRR